MSKKQPYACALEDKAVHAGDIRMKMSIKIDTSQSWPLAITDTGVGGLRMAAVGVLPFTGGPGLAAAGKIFRLLVASLILATIFHQTNLLFTLFLILAYLMVLITLVKLSTQKILRPVKSYRVQEFINI